MLTFPSAVWFLYIHGVINDLALKGVLFVSTQIEIQMEKKATMNNRLILSVIKRNDE